MTRDTSSDDEDRTVIGGPPQPVQDIAATNTARAAGNGNALPMGTYLGEFELVEVLGEGGFGIVYKAWDHSLERHVALKEYMPSGMAARHGDSQVQVRSERHRDAFEAGRKSFVNEAKLLAQFDHPALVKVYRFWEANGTAYMVMPLYEGITLKDWLRQRSTAPDESWLMELLGPLSGALAIIHAANCYHRDIAPDNVILLADNGRPLLLDFGAARRVIGDMTQALTVILKPGYAPLEQYAEVPQMKQGPWTDVYALAASVHFAIVGKTPPPAVGRLVNDSYQPLAEAAAGRYSARFLQAIDKALRVRPEERTQDIAELRADLGLDASTPAAAPRQIPAATHHAEDVAAGGRRTGLWTSAGALLLGAAGLGGYWLVRSAPPSSSVKPPIVDTALATTAIVTPAAVPATLPTTTAAAPRFDVQAEFERVLGGQDPGFQIQALPAKKTLRIGHDSLTFDVSSSRDGYVQVLLLGPEGSLLQLFPNSKARHNRIKAGQTLRLPQASWALEASEPAGPEHFLVVISAQPRDYAALGAVRDGMFLQLPTGAPADALAAQWQQPTPMLLGTAPTNCQGKECESYGAVRFMVEVAK